MGAILQVHVCFQDNIDEKQLKTPATHTHSHIVRNAMILSEW